jgi:hypothetical protein
MIFLYFIRYFAIINKNKNNVYQRMLSNSSQQTRTEIIIHKILRVSSSTWFTILLIVIAYVVIVLIFVIVMAANSFICKFSTLIAIRTVNSIELIIIYSLTILSLVSDLIPNWYMLIRFKWIEYVFYSDQFWFRAQIIIFIPFMIYSLAIELYAVIIGQTFFGIASSFTTHLVLNTICTCLISLGCLVSIVFDLF